MSTRERTEFGPVLGNGEFRALMAGELISILGDQIARVALALLVFDRTNSAALTAITYACTFLPALAGGLFLSGLADRFPRRTVQIVTDLIRLVLAGAMAIPGMPLPVLWLLVVLLTGAYGPYRAAQLALIAQVLPADKYAAGMSVRQVVIQVAQLVGFGCGGVVVAELGTRTGLLLNSGTFLVAALVVLIGVRHRPAPTPEPATASAPASSVGGSASWVAGLFMIAGAVGLYVVPEGIAAPYAHTLGVGATGLGLLYLADPVGSIVGSFLLGRARSPASYRRLLILAAAGAVPLILCVIRPGLLVTLLLWTLAGGLSTAYLIDTGVLLRATVPDHRRGRVLGRYTSTIYASQGVAVLLGGVVAQGFGVFIAVAAAGAAALSVVMVLGGWSAARAWLTTGAPATGRQPSLAIRFLTVATSLRSSMRDRSPRSHRSVPDRKVNQ